MSSALRRAVSTIAVAALVAAVCVMLGVWQWNRHIARSQAVAVLESWSQADPAPIAGVLNGSVQVDQVWQPVSATGHYLADAQVLLRNRPVHSQPGYHVLAPFVIDVGPLAGSALLVDRGFVPRGPDAAVLPTVPGLPEGQVELVARLRVEEEPSGRGAPEGQVQAINAVDAQAAATAWETPILSGYGQAVTENGARPAELAPLQTPSTDLGPHLSYAFQWWVFATGALVGGAILVRRDRHPPPSGPTRRTGHDEEVEDALLDGPAATR